MWEREIRRLASGQHGLIDRESVRTLGATDGAIQHQLRVGRWLQIHPGVYYLNVTPRTWHTEVLAAVLAGGHLALASHRTAARLYNLDGIGGRVIELTVPHDDRPLPGGALVHRTRRAPIPDVVHGIPATTPERTLHDLAAFLPPLPLEKAYMSALHLKHTTPDRMAE